MQNNPDDEAAGHAAHVGSEEIAVRALVAGTAAAVGLHAGPEATVLAAASTPFVEAALIPTIRRWSDYVSQLGARASKGDQAGLSRHLAAHPEAAALLADAGLASARTDYEVKLEAIAQAISGGVLYEDGVAFDRDAMLVRIICGLDRASVSVLGQVVRAPKGVSVDVIESQLPELWTVAHRIVAELRAAGLVRTRAVKPGRGLDSLMRLEAHLGGDPLVALARELDEGEKKRRKEKVEATPTGVLVVKRFLGAAESLGTSAPNTRVVGDGIQEYVGLVVPTSETWDEPRYALSGAPLETGTAPRPPYERPGWVALDEHCAACGSVMVAEAVFIRYYGHDSDAAHYGEDTRCPVGCVQPDESGAGEDRGK